jgi:hypothetical protein
MPDIFFKFCFHLARAKHDNFIKVLNFIDYSFEIFLHNMFFPVLFFLFETEETVAQSCVPFYFAGYYYPAFY